MHVANGMEEGVIDSMDRIAELVASAQRGLRDARPAGAPHQAGWPGCSGGAVR